MRVYKINFEVDEYRSLLAKDARVHERRLLALDGTSKVSEWAESLEAILDNVEAPEPDIYSCGAGNMLIFGRSLELLKPVLQPVAELLPVSWDGGHGFLVNILGFADCLDLDRTDWLVSRTSGKKLFIRKHVFIGERLPRFRPFKVEAQRFAMFCADHDDGSETFHSLLGAQGLCGVKFDLVWESVLAQRKRDSVG